MVRFLSTTHTSPSLVFPADESPDDLSLRSSSNRSNNRSNNRARKVQGTYNVYLVVAAVMAALGGMLFGYDTGESRDRSWVWQELLTTRL